MLSRKKLIIFLIAGIVLLIIFLPGYINYHKLASRNAKLRKQIKEVKDNNFKLKEESRRLENDVFYMEQVARERMGVAKEGEVVYKIIPESKK